MRNSKSVLFGHSASVCAGCLLTAALLLSGCASDNEPALQSDSAVSQTTTSEAVTAGAPSAPPPETTTEYKPAPKGSDTTVFVNHPPATVAQTTSAPEPEVTKYESYTDGGSFSSSTGTKLNLRVEWTAESGTDGRSVTLKAKVWLDFIRLSIVDERTCTLVVTIDGVEETRTFTTGKIRETSNAYHSVLIGEAEFTRERDPEDELKAVVSADWTLGGSYSGVYIGKVKAEKSLTFPALAKEAGAAETTSKQAATTSKPAETTSKPAETTAKPAETTAKPAETTSKPAVTTSKPAETTSKPTKPAETTIITAREVTPAAITLTGNEKLAMSGVFSTDTGTNLNLRVLWTATQAPGDKYVTVKADVYLDYVRLFIGQRNGSITVNGCTKSFTTSAFSVGEDAYHSKKLTSFEVYFERTPGEDALLEIDCDWYLGGRYTGVWFGKLEAGAEIVLSEKYSLLPKSFSISAANIMQTPELPNGCEITSLAILLNYLGYGADKLDLNDNYLDIGPVGSTSFYEKNVGNPRDTASFGCYSPVIVRSADKYFAANGGMHAAVDLTRHSVDELYYSVSQGKPVVVWITGDIEKQPEIIKSWTVGGETFNWKHPLHCVVLTGYDFSKGTVTVSDPLKGTQTLSKELFELRWRQMGAQAVTVAETGVSIEELTH